MTATLISVFVDKKLYDRCITNNPYIKADSTLLLYGIDNTSHNEPVSKRYNQFLNSFDYSVPQWLIFCHSDFEFCENIEALLANLDKESIYGPIGAILCSLSDGSYVREYRGQCYERRRDGTNLRHQLSKVSHTGVLVDSLDCQCMIVHSSLIKRFGLRFDERLSFDLYVEDFCISALESHGVKSRIVNMSCCHWNQADSMEGRNNYFIALEYCNEKYIKRSYAGVVTLIGKDSPMVKYINLAPKIEFLNQEMDSRSTVYRVPEVSRDAVNDSKSLLFQYVEPDATVMDVGCACGDLGVALHKHKNCKMYGLEYDWHSVKIAVETGSYEQVKQADLNSIVDIEYVSYIGKFDVIIFGDVLEHVYDPEEVLRKMVHFLKPSGYFLISLPNMAHASIKASLMDDDFTYTDVGLLDRTHIRFFTHKTIPTFLANNLLKLISFKYTTFNILGFQPSNPYPALPAAVRLSIFTDPHSFVCQYIMKVFYSPLDSYVTCVEENRKISHLDEGLNPFLSEYQRQASAMNPNGADNHTSYQNSIIHSSKFCSGCRERARNLLFKFTLVALLLPSSFFYVNSIGGWLNGLLRGKSFFVDILNNNDLVLNKIINKSGFMYSLTRKSLNRAIMLFTTNSFRVTFFEWKSALRNLFRR